MIKYNKLEIKGDYLIVDFEVEDKPYYSSVSIQGIRIDIPLTYGKETPYPIEGTDPIEDTDDRTHYTKEFFIPDIKKELIIITPQCYTDEIPSDSPCGAEVVNASAVYDKNILLEKGLYYIKNLGSECEVSKDFIDFILRHKALDMAIDTCNFNTAIKYWDMFKVTKGVTTKGCGCNGS